LAEEEVLSDMKIAISATGPDLDAQVDPRFGRCPCFVVMDLETEGIEVLENQAAIMSGGAGIQAAQMVVNAGVTAVITGNLGPNATDTLAAAGVKTYLGATGTVREALEQYEDGQLHEATGAAVEANYGLDRSTGGGFPGRGMGRGMGRGVDRGFLPGRQDAPANDLEELKRQKDQLKEQMNRIEQRIKELEKKK
jgi:predicted Fe-Mo cluster-binding NifX family protein